MSPENSFDFDATWAWTSSPITISQSPVAPGMRFEVLRALPLLPRPLRQMSPVFSPEALAQAGDKRQWRQRGAANQRGYQTQKRAPRGAPFTALIQQSWTRSNDNGVVNNHIVQSHGVDTVENDDINEADAATKVCRDRQCRPPYLTT